MLALLPPVTVSLWRALASARAGRPPMQNSIPDCRRAFFSPAFFGNREHVQEKVMSNPATAARGEADLPGNPSRITRCRWYADDNHAGQIINLVAKWTPYAHLRRKNISGVWSVFTRAEICRGARLSLWQYRQDRKSVV